MLQVNGSTSKKEKGGPRGVAALKIIVRKKFLWSQVGNQEVEMQSIAEVLLSRLLHQGTPGRYGAEQNYFTNISCYVLL